MTDLDPDAVSAARCPATSPESAARCSLFDDADLHVGGHTAHVGDNKWVSWATSDEDRQRWEADHANT